MRERNKTIDQLRKEYHAVLECGEAVGCPIRVHPDVATLSDMPADLNFLQDLIGRCVLAIVRTLAVKYL